MRNTKRKYKWCLEWNEGILFISEDRLVHFSDLIPNKLNGMLTLQELNPETYRGSEYFRLDGESKRIAKSTINRKAEKCTILI